MTLPYFTQDIEAVLFLLQGVTSNITDDTSHVLCNIVSIFPRLPLQHTVLRTVLRLIGNSTTRHYSLLLLVLDFIALEGSKL